MVVTGNFRSNAELRRSTRVKVSQKAWIIFGGPAVECKIENVSSSGAALILNRDSSIPDEFALILTSRGDVKRRCEVVWRSSNKLGVRFLK